MVNLILSDLGLESNDIKLISNKIQKFKCEYCSYSPFTQIAGQTYLFYKSSKNKLSLDLICTNLSISKNSVYLYLNPKNHSCAKNW